MTKVKVKKLNPRFIDHLSVIDRSITWQTSKDIEDTNNTINKADLLYICKRDMNLSKLQETVEDRYRGAWCAATYEVSKRWTGLSN